MIPDISEHNGSVDWDLLNAAYLNGVIEAVAMRAGFGTVRADLQFARNQSEARRRGIPNIPYWFNYPAYNSPEAEAAMFNSVVGVLQSGEAMAGDFEDDPSARPWPRGQAALDWSRGFLTAVQAPQNATWWYASPNFISEVGLVALEGAWPGWVADWSITPDSAYAWAIARQFTDCGSLAGISGCCDQSRVLQGPLSQWLTQGEKMTPEEHGWLQAIYTTMTQSALPNSQSWLDIWSATRVNTDNLINKVASLSSKLDGIVIQLSNLQVPPANLDPILAILQGMAVDLKEVKGHIDKDLA